MNEMIVRQKCGEIDANFEEVKAYLDEQLDIYGKMVFTEETKTTAKNTVAELRKGQKDILARCKEVKKEYMIPLDNFLAKANELAQMFDKPISFINEQIDAFEQKRIAEKKVIVSNIYAELVPEEDIKQIIPLTKIYNSKWENATFKEKDIKAEIMERKLNCKNAVEMICSFHSEMEERAMEIYKSTLDMSEAVLFITNYENQKKAILERERELMRANEEERIRAEERKRILSEQKAEEEKAKAVEDAKAEVIENLIPTDSGSEERGYSYTMMLTEDAKSKVDTFLNRIGIEFFAMEVD